MVQFLSQFIADIDPQKLGEAYQNFYEQISQSLHQQIYDQYNQLQSKKLGHSPQDVALRSFKNHLLSYLYKHNEEEGADLFFNQFQNAHNMTDTLAALGRLSYHGSQKYQQAMDQFYDQWKNDSLVMNKWLAVSAFSKAENSFEQIQSRAQSDAFDINNPNNVFALFYSFAQYNWPRFHQKSGDTYNWIADQIIDIDGRNPQVSARLGSCFNNWKKFSTAYQDPIKRALNHIIDSNPSDNLFEIVSRALKN